VVRRQVWDQNGDSHFVTFSCYKRRRLLDADGAKELVVQALAKQLPRQAATCVGFVIMPHHVHALLWFPETGQLSPFMKYWKQKSSGAIKALFRERFTSYAAQVDPEDPVWQPRYYDFNVRSDRKLREKLDYMHSNPVAAGLVKSPTDWRYSSARWHESNEGVGVPIEFGD
jgi:REP-associated tyrosine transposase